MIHPTLDSHIEITPGVYGGKPRIAGRRITVQDVAIWHERLGMTADRIAEEFELSLADIHAALAYYFDHRQDIDRRIQEDDALVAALKAETPSILRENSGMRGPRDRGIATSIHPAS